MPSSPAHVPSGVRSWGSFPQFIYDKDTNPVPMAFFVIAVIFGLGSILAYTILLSGSTERIHYEVKKDTYKYSEVLPWHLLLPSIPWG